MFFYLILLLFTAFKNQKESVKYSLHTAFYHISQIKKVFSMWFANIVSTNISAPLANYLF